LKGTLTPQKNIALETWKLVHPIFGGFMMLVVMIPIPEVAVE
jgi:hypothetical protein